jgi:hypothetical protein
MSSLERSNDYWIEGGGGRHAMFEAIFNLYPKRENELNCMAAWRLKFGTMLDGDEPEAHALWDAIYQGVQRYAALVKKERRESQYILGMVKWIRDERWNDAQHGGQA